MAEGLRPNHDFQPGSILRIRLHNFLTYEDAEVTPGARLNVVVGPNGSGKSSILCAIALVLGGGASLLDRADTVREFVMRGKDKGYMEITLKGKRDKDVIIRRDLDARNNRSIWHIDGSLSTQSAARKIVKELNIMVDNLCCFMPQEKVGEFSQWNPQTTLLETMRAVCPEDNHLNETHKMLIEKQRGGQKSEKDRDEVKGLLENREEQNRSLQRDKERMDERKRYLDRVRTYGLICQYGEHEIESKQVDLLAKELTDLQEALTVARERIKPYESRVRKFESQKAQANIQMRKSQQAFEQLKQDAERALTLADQQNGLIAMAAQEVNNIRNKREHLEHEVAQARKDLKQARIRQEASDPEKMKEQISSLKQQQRSWQAKQDEKTQKVDEVKRRLREAEEELTYQKRQLEQLRDQQNVRTEHLRTSHWLNGQDAVGLKTWLNSNRDRLRGRVFGPLALEISIDNPAIAAMVEAQIPSWGMGAFAVECDHDKELLLHEIHRRRWKVTVQQLQEHWERDVRTPYLSVQRMQALKDRFGIQGMLKDEIKAKPQVLCLLQNIANVHRALYGNAQTEKVISGKDGLLEGLLREGSADGGRSGLALVYTQQPTSIRQHTGSRSKYSPHTITSSKIVDTAKLLATSSTDEDSIKQAAQLDTQIRAGEGEAAQAREDLRLEQEELAVYRTQLEGVGRKLTQCKNLLKSDAELQNQVRRREVKVKKLEADLAKDTEAERQEAQRQVTRHTTTYVTTILSASRLNEELLQAWERTVSPRMAATMADSLHISARRKLDEQMQDFAETEGAVRSKKTEHGHSMDSLKAKRRRLDETFRGEPNLKQEAQRILPAEDSLSDIQKKLDGLRRKIQEAQASAEAIVDNPDAIRNYERLQEEIARLQERYEKLRRDCDDSERGLERQAADWTKKLIIVTTKLHVKFSQYMSEMGCAGQVDLVQVPEDYSKWGLSLKVKFRQEQPLEQLKATVQSGGERSVSTILFLMALQDMLPSPFRAVDEINQGMDEKNETMVFRRIILNSENVQYFLITPKLMQRLTCLEQDHVSVLFVMNAPDILRYNQWKVNTFLEAARRRLWVKDEEGVVVEEEEEEEEEDASE